MASVLKGGFALALIMLFVISSSFQTISVAEARSPYRLARQLATDCNSPVQGDVAGCGSGGGSGGSSRPVSGRCKKGCCRRNKLQECTLCCK